jgi:hypothetical protein
VVSGYYYVVNENTTGRNFFTTLTQCCIGSVFPAKLVFVVRSMTLQACTSDQKLKLCFMIIDSSFVFLPGRHVI